MSDIIRIPTSKGERIIDIKDIPRWGEVTELDSNVYNFELYDVTSYYPGMCVVGEFPTETVGYPVSLAVNNQLGGLAILPILNPDGTEAQNFKIGGIYTFRLNTGMNAFILQ